MNVAIVCNSMAAGDEIKRVLRTFLNKHQALAKCDISIIMDAGEFREKFKIQVFHLVIIDTQIEQNQGIQFACELRTYNKNFSLLFVSENPDLVYDSFLAEPVYFLNKKCLHSDMKKAIDVLERKGFFRREDSSVVWKVGVSNVCMNPRNIVYIYKEKNWLVFVTEKGKRYKFRGTISQIEKQIKPYDFVKIECGCIVNLSYVSHIKELQLYLKDGKNLYISRRNRRLVEQAFHDYKVELTKMTV